MDFIHYFRPDLEKSIASKDVRGIIRALSNPDTAIQRKAAAALADLAPDEAVSPLLHTLLSPDRDVRRLSAMALGNIRDSTASSGLVTALGDTDPRVRLEVAEALGKIRNPVAVGALLQCLEDSNADVRMNTIWALGRMEDKKAIPSILSLLANPDHGIRLRAAEALEKLNGVPGDPQDKALYYIAKNEWDEIPRIREAAIKPLVWALKDDYYDIRMRAARTLGIIRSPIAVEALNKALFDLEECVSLEAVEALSSIGTDEAIRSLVDGLSSPYKTTRTLASTALERVGWQPSPDLKKTLEAPDREEWDICCSMRGMSPDTPLVSKESAVTPRIFSESANIPKNISRPVPVRPPIQLRSSQNPPVTPETMKLHGISNDTRSALPLNTTPDDPDQGIRQQCTRDLSQLIKPPAVESLIRVLETDDPVLYKQALRGLGAIKTPATVASLAQATRNPDINVRLGAIIALGIISRRTGSDRIPDAGTGMLGEKIQDTTGKQAAEALLELKESTPLIAGMIGTLSHPYAYMRRGAADVLQVIGWKPGNDDEQLLFNAAHPSSDEWTDSLEKDRGPGAEKHDESHDLPDDIIAKMADPRISTEKKIEFVQQMGMSGDPRYTDVLIAALQDSDPRICLEAMLACGKRGDQHSVPFLIFLVNVPDTVIRKRAIETLGVIKDYSSIPSIIEAIHDKDQEIRNLALLTLGVFQDPLSVQALVMNFTDEDPFVKETVSTALNMLGVYALHQVRDLLISDNTAQRFNAREVIKKNYGHTIALKYFICLLQTSDKTIIQEAAGSLKELGWTPAVDKNFVNYFIARCDGKTQEEMGGGSLVKWLKDKNPEVRKGALMVLSRMKPASSSQIITSVLQDPDSEVRALVASNLAAIDWHPENEFQNVIFLFAQKKWTELEKCKKNATGVLTEGLTDRDPEVRQASMELLGTIGSKTAISALMEGLHNDDREVRFASLRMILKKPSHDGADLVSILKKERW